jgi:iron(III) transport system ATP-binding protein
MADEIGVMDGGFLQQWDTGYRLYHEPANRFVADFVGQGVLLAGELTAGGQVATELGLVQGPSPTNGARNASVEILIRPDDVVIDPESQVQAKVVERLFRGAHFLYTLRLPSGTRILSVAPSHQAHEPGEEVGLRLDIDHVVTFDRG